MIKDHISDLKILTPVSMTHHHQLNSLYRQDETEVVRHLLDKAQISEELKTRIRQRADAMVEEVRRHQKHTSFVDAFMQHYDLSKSEGLLLMAMAEALLRIPDRETIGALLRDKLSQAHFEQYKKTSSSTFVKTATWLLDMAKTLMDTPLSQKQTVIKKLLTQTSEPVVRFGSLQAMKMLANKFICGETIEDALKNSKNAQKRGYTHSYDMLGESALTSQDADRYYESYLKAIRAFGTLYPQGTLQESPGISIKLSALHPRYESTQRKYVLEPLAKRLGHLAQEAAKVNIGLTVDAEEAERLQLSLEIMEAALQYGDLSGWQGFGLAIQAYQKRALEVLEWVKDMASHYHRIMNVRLVKGAYWDSEIKRSQELGLSGYPVFTRKMSTDLSYLVCARRLLNDPDKIYPQFATHNAYTIASILEFVRDSGIKSFEFQKLQGMGDALYDQIVKEHPVKKAQDKKQTGKEKQDEEWPHKEHVAEKFPSDFYLPVDRIFCRIYAPVGHFKDLLPYLVRRLLENGANSSFVNALYNPAVPLDELNQYSADVLEQESCIPNFKIPVPRGLYGLRRENSKGLDFSNKDECEPLDRLLKKPPSAKGGPLIEGHDLMQASQPRFASFNSQLQIGEVSPATEAQVRDAFNCATKATRRWRETPVSDKAHLLEAFANLMTRDFNSLVALCIYEGGKTVSDAVAEVREAIDFCRYYAQLGVKDFAKPLVLQGPTGEENRLFFEGRGVFLCISPWNFPLAIFVGQVTAALVAGNTVLAKPADPTPLLATVAIRLMHEAGVPSDVIQLIPMKGSVIGKLLLEDPRLSGVAFTGSIETAQIIQRHLAQRETLIPLIAETGGQNVMVVDSSALPEQVVQDVVRSAFQSAGQRCSALRILCLQEEVADTTLQMLQGAMAELRVGDPCDWETDIGPVIDSHSQRNLENHIQEMGKKAKILYQTPVPEVWRSKGSFVSPTLIEINRLSDVSGEKFGPILHVLRYPLSGLETLIDDINALGFGLTFGLHTRLDHRIDWISKRVRMGNIYVNRNMIGAVVGVQPFGGQGLSGTGPKAGGPYYLHRFAVEKTVSVNTTAQGGNAALLVGSS